MQNRELIEEQIRELQQKAVSKPMPDDPMGMTGMLATLVAAKMQALLLQADSQERQSNENR